MDSVLNEVVDYKLDENEDYYAILGCDELSSVKAGDMKPIIGVRGIQAEQILAEYKARVLSCHPDKHPGDEKKAKEFERIQTAKDVLCDAEKREGYDKWRHAGISISYRRWCNMRESVHTSMHWATPRKECMLEDTDGGGGGGGSDQRPPGHVVMQGKHAPGDMSFLRTGDSSPTSTGNQSVPWSQDSPSEMLRKFRNYEI